MRLLVQTYLQRNKGKATNEIWHQHLVQRDSSSSYLQAPLLPLVSLASLQHFSLLQTCLTSYPSSFYFVSRVVMTARKRVLFLTMQ